MSVFADGSESELPRATPAEENRRVQHLARMYAALGATNEAILRAREPTDLYQRVCDAAVETGNFIGSAVIIADWKSTWVTFKAAAGENAANLATARISLDRNSVEGQGLVGLAFHTAEPAISNDFLADPRTAAWHRAAERAGYVSAAAIPLLQDDAVIGALLFYAAEKNAFDADVVSLVERIARNIVFALDNFGHDAERKVIEEALQAGEARYRTILDTMQNAYSEIDMAGRYLTFNPAFTRLTGYSTEELKGATNLIHQTPAMAKKCLAICQSIFQDGVSKSNQEWEYLRKDGSVLHVEGSVQLLKDDSGTAIGFYSVMSDVTERWNAIDALRESEARFRVLTNLSSDWYWEQDTEFRLIRIDGRHASSDDRRHPFLGLRSWEGGFEIDAPGGWEAHREILAQRQDYRDLVLHRMRSNGKRYFISVSGTPTFDAHGNFTGYRGISREITEQKVAEERIQYLATHDALTGLPNRAMFSHLLNLAIPTAQRYERRFAVLFIDLDRFKFINDTLGHEAGDALLNEVTSRFKLALRASDAIARLGGDEFVVMVQEMAHPEQAAHVARKLLSAAMKPVVLMGHECRVTASIGIAVYPNDGEDEQSLMKNADIAMYFAKEEGKNNFQFYSKDIKSQSLELMIVESNLRHAMERNEFTLHYQAKVDLKTNSITGVEALLRWNNAALGSVPPVQFIPVAEETGLIVAIGIWVLRTACIQNVVWQQQGLPPICVAVNLSVRQFADDNLLTQIASVLSETAMPPHLLELEITEGMVVHNPERAIKLLTAIKAMGVRLAIDDFGTGYSSLGQLKNFPIDTLKVDRSFIRDLATDSEDKAITKAIIAMGKTLSLTVVAEGVETIEQESFLREFACDQMQGFYFSKPIAAEDFGTLLRQHVPGVPRG